jgi:hypothetical protein
MSESSGEPRSREELEAEFAREAKERREELERQLAEIKEQEQREKEEKALAEQAEREAKLDPETRAQKEELERRADEALEREFPPAWLPQKDKTHPERLVGLAARIDLRVGPSKVYGTYAAIIELLASDGRRWTAWAPHSGSLYAQLVRQRIQPGEVIAIKYRGLKPSESNPGQSYNDFRLARVDDDKPAGRVDYDAIQSAEEPPALPPGEHPPANTPVEPDDDIPF